ncbi:unnamed protein product [Blepharisma stoltei]|uniref:Enoyl reductase (ER) domain-containing protein n=1 Tax=Blepharisma stoltei TaxID=1481888 RepID=A0AAU9IF95_9CILI|nr:unnamed protein product [Blepharisma stoltei]
MANKTKTVVADKLGNFNTLGVKEMNIPDVPEGYVLIRTEFATLNPMDELMFMGKYFYQLQNKTLGIEGSGTVVRSGGGALPNSLLNKRVCFMAYGPNSTGAFSEFCVTDARFVLPIKDNIPFEQAATMFSNALTTELHIRKIKKGNHRAVIINAAASMTGKSLIKYCCYLGIPVIAIVRGEEDAVSLRTCGTENIIVSSNEGWLDRAKDLSRHLGATIAFDAISGEHTGHLYELIQEPGVVYVYGGLSTEPCTINPMSFSPRKKLKGLSFMKWWCCLPTLKRIKLCERVEKLMEDIFNTNYCATVNLNGVKDAMATYHTRKTDNKFLIRTRTN